MLIPKTSLPPCPDHDSTKWHALIDYTRKCHYDHEHGDDPHDADAMFGPWADLWGDQELSYPWQTFSIKPDGSKAMENDVKHGGYKFYVNTALPDIGSHFLNWSPDLNKPGQNNWITGMRIVYHFHGHLDAAVRLHSFYAQYKICMPGGDAPCGTVSGGGWWDTGYLESPYQGIQQTIPGQDPSHPKEVGHDPYRGHSACPSHGGHNAGLWTSLHKWGLPTTSTGYPIEFNNHLGLFVIHHDVSSCTVQGSHGGQQMICPDGKCWYNNSLRAPFVLWAWVDKDWDGKAGFDEDGVANGFVTYHGYTDRTGKPASGCSQAALDCIPWVLDKAPVGYGAWVTTDNGFLPEFPGLNHEFDTSPPGEFWIDVSKN
jgi:hypothetical protein